MAHTAINASIARPQIRSNYTSSSHQPSSTHPTSPYSGNSTHLYVNHALLDASVLFDKEYSHVYKLIEDAELRNRYFEVLRKNHAIFSGSEISTIHSTFSNLIDIQSGFPSPQALDILIDMWEMVFANAAGTFTPLQAQIFQEKDKFIHILINSRNYRVYERLVRPLYKISPQLTWADRLVTMFELEDVNGVLSMNRSAIVKFLKSDQDIKLKRKVISILIHRVVLNATDDSEKNEHFKLFVELCHIVGDDHFLFIDPEYIEYAKVVRLMAIPRDPHLRGISEPASQNSPNAAFMEHVTKLQDFFEGATPAYFNFITSSMHHIISFSPNNVLNYWKFKADHSKSHSSAPILSHHDLKIAMSALSSLKLYPEVLHLYKSYPNLHHEDQIEVLLRVSELSKDWKLLQTQFEEMYGKGKLPYVIHYAIVMKALAGIGARDEVDMLFDQLKKRKLTPTASIFTALISSRLHYNDVASAKKSFDLYMSYVNLGTIEKSTSAYLYRLLFKMYIKSKDIEQVRAFLDEALEEQKATGIQLISSSSINDLIEFSSSNYELEFMEHLKNLAEDLELTNMHTYQNLIKGYTKLDQYEKANELIYKAHSSSEVPFANVDIYTAQLKTYRHWIRRIPDPEQKLFYQIKQAFIVSLVTLNHMNNISIRNNSGLHVEVIEYFLSRHDIENAQKMMNLSQKREFLAERHFLPFMKYHLRQNTYESYGEILNLYRKMVDQRIQISTKTYVYLMKALIYLDGMNNNNGENAYKLLKSIFEMNGLSLKPQTLSNTTSKVMMIDMIDRAEDLFKIVASYVNDLGTHQNDIDMLVHFLNEIKKILGGKLSLQFRFLIYREMSKIYQKQNNYSLAENLIDNGIEDLSAVVQKYTLRYPFEDHLEPILPVMLVKDLRNLLNTKIMLLEYGRKSPAAYLHILQQSSDQGVRLSGTQFNRLFKEVLKDDITLDTLKLILSTCENHLISGNWVEVKIMRKLQFMYKLTMLHLSLGLGNDSTIHKYHILSEYYDVHELGALKRELAFIGDSLQALEYQFEANRKTLDARGWDLDKLLENIPRFFIPERRIRSANKISPTNCYQIWLALHRHIGTDQSIAFKLMDEFPETLEFLMYNEPARIRLGFFRSKIDKILPPRLDYQETFTQRYQRTELALNSLRDVEQSMMD
ncbi:uncharacterized protein CANTADRAFT_7435 [Suhomyces tanzawaensis NRRL Y-17324]|uniref:Uncharacterized protein n=1 Tax=Suhomyces tanzawaensis NRRL Y-17324 TaxID=984487 RepID=A0A1E4SEL5_9ASCO|nr:uncharacterized protein CANTADRAFT_7435 [Suhomyces tanzawaensis NRRL Y-17324]ODV77964.1 hypothetical protein CANTADRAFT_7435 [Suhomyces tanzawaensis NRRL Y-17324]